MDQLELLISKYKDNISVVDIYINGVNIIDKIREIELPFANKEGHPKIAGNYVGLDPSTVFYPSRHLLGEPDPYYEFGDEKIAILECECGEAGCWPFILKVTFTENTVIWSEFEQPHRDSESATGEWSYEALKPFVFDREQYESELTKIL